MAQISTQPYPYSDQIDPLTGKIITISNTHHEIHEGEHFFFSLVDTDVDTGAPKYLRITTPNTTKWCHMEIRYTSTGAGTWEFFENPTINATGTAITIFNSNRNSLIAPTMTAFQDTTTQAPNNDGTLLWSDRTGVNGTGLTRNAGAADREDEIILKQNEDYIIKFTPDADNTQIVISFNYYEHISLA